MVEDPRDLIGRRLDFAIRIDGGELPLSLCNDIFCKYTLQMDEDVTEYHTKKFKGKHQYPNFKYKKIHTYECVNEKILSYLLNHNLCIEVFGYGEKKKALPFKDPKRDTDLSTPNMVLHTTPGKPVQKITNAHKPMAQIDPNSGIKNLTSHSSGNFVTALKEKEKQIYTPPIQQTRGRPVNSIRRGQEPTPPVANVKKKKDDCRIF